MAHLIMLVWKIDAIIINVKAAFLHGDLDEEIYMNLPDGMEGSNDECLLLLKALHRLVQGTCQRSLWAFSRPLTSGMAMLILA